MKNAIPVPAFDTLVAAVEADTNVKTSAATLIKSIADQLKALAAAGNVTPAQLTMLSDQLIASSATLTAAIIANTPAGPPTPAGASSTRR